jgi:hypothetical protein
MSLRVKNADGTFTKCNARDGRGRCRPHLVDWGDCRTSRLMLRP